MVKYDIQEIEIKKRSLKRYKKNLACIDRLEKKLDCLNEKIKSINSPVLSDMPRGGSPVKLEDLLSDKIELEERINQLKYKSKNLKQELLEEIDSLGDSQRCEILEAFFIEGVPLNDIAERTGYTIRHVYRLYSEGVAALACQ